MLVFLEYWLFSFFASYSYLISLLAISDHFACVSLVFLIFFLNCILKNWSCGSEDPDRIWILTEDSIASGLWAEPKQRLLMTLVTGHPGFSPPVGRLISTPLYFATSRLVSQDGRRQSTSSRSPCGRRLWTWTEIGSQGTTNDTGGGQVRNSSEFTSVYLWRQCSKEKAMLDSMNSTSWLCENWCRVKDMRK